VVKRVGFFSRTIQSPKKGRFSTGLCSKNWLITLGDFQIRVLNVRLPSKRPEVHGVNYLVSQILVSSKKRSNLAYISRSQGERQKARKQSGPQVDKEASGEMFQIGHRGRTAVRGVPAAPPAWPPARGDPPRCFAMRASGIFPPSGVGPAHASEVNTFTFDVCTGESVGPASRWPTSLKAGSNRLVLILICTGAGQNLAICGTNQGDFTRRFEPAILRDASLSARQATFRRVASVLHHGGASDSDAIALSIGLDLDLRWRLLESGYLW